MICNLFFTHSVHKSVCLAVFILFLLSIAPTAFASYAEFDFETNTFDINGSGQTINTIGFSAADNRTYYDGSLFQIGATNTPVVVDNELLLRDSATQLVDRPTEPSTWRSQNGATHAVTSNVFQGLTGVEIISGGNQDARYAADDTFAINTAAGESYAFSIIYEMASSSEIELVIRDADNGGLRSTLLVSYPGAPTVDRDDIGPFTDYRDVALSGSVRQLSGVYQATTSSTNIGFGIGPDSSVSGESVIVYGASILESDTLEDFQSLQTDRPQEQLAPNIPTGTYDIFVRGEGKEEMRTGVAWTNGDSIDPPHDAVSISQAYFWLSGDAPAVAIPERGTDIYILAGQSNMVGNEGPADHTTTDPYVPGIFSRVAVSGSSRLGGNVDAGDILPALDPLLHYGFSGASLPVGPGMEFARTLREVTHANRDILLLPTGEGGTGMVGDSAEWNPNATSGDGSLRYDTMIADATETVGLFANSEIKALYWSQGETDSGAFSDTTYPPPFTAFATSTRDALSEANLPILISGLNPDNVSYDVMNTAQANMDQDSGHPDAITFTRFIASPSGYNVGDDIHFTAAGNRIRGAAAAQALIDSGWVSFSTTTDVSGGGGGDVTAPSVPADLATTSVTDALVALSWSASTDGGSGVDFYSVYRDSVEIATTTNLTYIDNTVAAATSYDYTVSATDVAGNESAESGILTVVTDAAPDVTAPTLTSPTDTETGQTTSNGSVSTDEANGTLYWVVTTSATTPSAAQVRAGQDHTSAAAADDGSQAVSATGVQNITASGLTANTAYFTHYMHEDASANQSTVSSASGFTTDAVPDVTAPILSSPVDTSTGQTTASGQVTTDEANGTLYWVVTTSATTPSAAQVRAGQDHTSAAGVTAGTVAVSSTGVQPVSITGLIANTAYFTHYMHEDASTNQSTAVSADGFTTDTASSGGSSSGGGGGGGGSSDIEVSEITPNDTSVTIDGTVEEDAVDLYAVLSDSDTDTTPLCSNVDDEGYIVSETLSETLEEDEEFSVTVTDLDPTTTYYFRVCATIDDRTHDSDRESFTTRDAGEQAADAVSETEEVVAGQPVSTPVPTIPTTIPPTFTFSNNVSFIQSEVNNPVDVENIARFLNEFEGENLILDSTHSAADDAAVKRFQRKYSREILDVWNLTEATGYVGITTRLKMNFLLKGQTAQCPVFTEYNGGKTGIYVSDEVMKTKEVLAELDMYNGPIDRIWTPATNDALVVFQETFREVMLDPWNITSGTGFKYKTTNKFLNYFAGCDTGAVELENIGIYEGI